MLDDFVTHSELTIPTSQFDLKILSRYSIAVF